MPKDDAALCRGADNLIVLDMLNRLNSRITQLRSASLSDPARGATSMAEIRNLAAALLARDAMAARALPSITSSRRRAGPPTCGEPARARRVR